jgi:AcrR family transcriptional regulator
MQVEMPAVKPQRLSRADRARQTRLRMTRAAYRLFIERGYPATTMVDIAAAAGVAVQTLYFTFGTKAQLLQNVYDFAVLGDGDPIPPNQQPWYAQMLAANRLDAALRLLVDNTEPIFARTAPLDDFVRAASYDPEAARVRQYNERLRRDAWARTITHLSAKFPLRPGLELQYATDILLVLLGPSSYQSLVREYGWSAERWRTWCAFSIAQELFAESGIRPGTLSRSKRAATHSLTRRAS